MDQVQEGLNFNQFGNVTELTRINKMTFNDWLKDCDKLVSSRVGLGIDCLPDARWRDMFDDGMEPIDAIDDAYYDYWSDDIPEELWYGESLMGIG